VSKERESFVICAREKGEAERRKKRRGHESLSEFHSLMTMAPGGDGGIERLERTVLEKESTSRAEIITSSRRRANVMDAKKGDWAALGS